MKATKNLTALVDIGAADIERFILECDSLTAFHLARDVLARIRSQGDCDELRKYLGERLDARCAAVLDHLEQAASTMPPN